MRCPYCRGDDDKVVDSRAAEDGEAIRRRRECLACGRRFTTYERGEALGLVVVKRSGHREPFDVDKLVRGLGRAVTGRPVESEVEAIAAEIEAGLRSEGVETSSEAIGRAVLERLQGLDPVSYLRFASVYKGFEDVADFQREVTLLRKTTAPKARRPKS